MRNVDELKTRIVAFHRIAVWVGEQQYELKDSLLISLANGNVFQLSSDAHGQTLVRLESRRDYRIDGEWSDRSRDELVDVYTELTPLDVKQLFTVHETDTYSGHEFLIGILLMSSFTTVGLKAHLDDVDISLQTEFFDYLAQVLPATREVRIRRR